MSSSRNASTSLNWLLKHHRYIYCGVLAVISSKLLMTSGAWGGSIREVHTGPLIQNILTVHFFVCTLWKLEVSFSSTKTFLNLKKECRRRRILCSWIQCNLYLRICTLHSQMVHTKKCWEKKIHE